MALRGSAAIRLVAGLALAVALTAAVAPVPGSRALAQTDDNQLASITIYTAVCPPGYAGDDLFVDCFANPAADVAYLLTGPAFPEAVTTSTDASGFAVFEGIDAAGEYLLQVDVALDFVAFCSDEFGDPFPVADESAAGGIGLDLTLDDDLRCDFYLIPSPAGSEGFPLTAITTACEQEPTAHLFAGGGCFPVPATVTYTTVASDFLASCVTEPSGPASPGSADVPVALCTVEVPFGITVVATADEAAFPAGYVIARPNPQSIDIPDGPPEGEFGGPVFLALPEAVGDLTPTPQPTQASQPTATSVTLPGTGTGSPGGADDPVWRLVGALALAAVTCAGLAVGRARFAAGPDRLRR